MCYPTSSGSIRVYNIDMVKLRTEGNVILLPVKVVPGASRTRLMGEWDGRAKIAVAAPPEKGKANQAVEKFIAGLLGLKRIDVSVCAGRTSSVKTIRIARAGLDAVRAAIELD